MKDLQCPYCNEWCEVCHDDGEGYDEDTLHQMECEHCEKNFTFYTSVSFHYDPRKADCLNGDKSECDWMSTCTCPVEATKMRCATCDDRRLPTDDEWVKIKEAYNG